MTRKSIFSIYLAVLVTVCIGPATAMEEAVLGNPEAPVTIIEFASLSCPHCAAFHKERFPWLKKNFIDTGKVKFIFRDFPSVSYTHLRAHET